MFGNKIKIDKELMGKIKKGAVIAGYASPEEFVVHALEKELARLEKGEEEDEVKKRLKGLGYL